jgi:hypothetical protein
MLMCGSSCFLCRGVTLSCSMGPLVQTPLFGTPTDAVLLLCVGGEQKTYRRTYPLSKNSVLVLPFSFLFLPNRVTLDSR